MTQWQGAVTGDVGDIRTIRLDGVDDLTAATAFETRVWKGDQSAVLTTTLVSAVERTVTVNLGGTTGWLKTAELGTWFVKVFVSFGASQQLSWPNGPQADTIEVRTDV